MLPHCLLLNQIHDSFHIQKFFFDILFSAFLPMAVKCIMGGICTSALTRHSVL